MSKTNKALQISISILCALLLVASFLVVLLPTAGHTVAQAADLSTSQLDKAAFYISLIEM